MPMFLLFTWTTTTYYYYYYLYPWTPMTPASDIYQSSPDWTIPYPLYTTTFAGIPWMRTPLGFLIFFFHDYVHLAPGKRFLFIDLAIIIKDTKNQGATCTISNATRARAEGVDRYQGDFLFLPIRDTQCLFPFGMTRASEPELYARRRIATNEAGSTGRRLLFV